MAITHAASVRNTLATAVHTAINAGSGAGYVKFMTSGDVEVATVPLNDPAGTVTGAVLTFDVDPIPEDASATGGVIAKFKIYDSNNTEVYGGSVTATGGGGDITFPNVTITAGEKVQITSMSYTAAP